jgi:hypothetical protein
MSEEIKTVEVSEPVVAEEVQRPSVDEAKAAGWSAKEIESAKKRNMLVEDPKPEAVATKDVADKVAADAVAKAKETPEQEAKPSVNFLDEMDKELTPEQEKFFLQNFPPGTKTRAFYFRAKNERAGRQRAEAKAKELEDRLRALEAAPAAAKPVLDEDGNEIDPEDKPLTEKRLREIRLKEQEEFETKQREQQERTVRLTEAAQTQEQYAKTIYPDFEQVVKRAVDVMTGLNNGTMDINQIVPEKWKQNKANLLWNQMTQAHMNADKFELEDYHAAFIAYELGQLLSSSTNGQRAEKDGTSKDPKASGGLTPEQMKRAEINTQRRASSASIPGGNGKRTVTAEEVTPEDLNRMDYKERARFKENHPREYAKLVR